MWFIVTWLAIGAAGRIFFLFLFDRYVKIDWKDRIISIFLSAPFGLIEVVNQYILYRKVKNSPLAFLLMAKRKLESK